MASTSINLAILDNSLLESSMGSTQGLLSFMTDASRQIKTYLGDSEQKTQKKQRHERLLHHLKQLNSQNDFIPAILQTPTYLTPASPTPSLDSVGSVEEDIDRPSCLMSRKRKRSHTSASSVNTTKRRRQSDYFNFAPTTCKFDVNTTFTNSFHITPCHVDTDIFNDPRDAFVPSPSPDFDDLVDCLTDDFIAPIDLNPYLCNP